MGFGRINIFPIGILIIISGDNIKSTIGVFTDMGISHTCKISFSQNFELMLTK